MRTPVLFAFCFLLVMADQVRSEEPYGREDYMRYCSACHGEDADGKGPVANVLKPPPPALTQLHQKFGRPLGTDLVVFVMGEKTPRAHGTSDMPVWGRNLRESGSGQQESLEIIWRIVDYLDTLQSRP